MKRINYLFGALILAAGAMTLPAQAAPILSGNSNSSTFLNLGCTVTCPNTTLSSSMLTIGSTAPGGSDSVLSIVNTSFSASGNVTGLQLAQLSLLVGQKPGTGQSGITFDYNLVLTFSTPLGSQSQTFNLAGSGDGGAGANADVLISGLGPLSLTDPLILSGVTLSNFRFDTVAGDTDSVFANGIWDGSKQGTTHSLFLLADVTANRVVPVPEPAEITLFGAGLLGLMGLGAMRRRKPASV
jgi:hypothetical protein